MAKTRKKLIRFLGNTKNTILCRCCGLPWWHWTASSKVPGVSMVGSNPPISVPPSQGVGGGVDGPELVGAVAAHGADVGPHGARHHVLAVELLLGRFRSPGRERGRSWTVRSRLGSGLTGRPPEAG